MIFARQSNLDAGVFGLLVTGLPSGSSRSSDVPHNGSISSDGDVVAAVGENPVLAILDPEADDLDTLATLGGVLEGDVEGSPVIVAEPGSEKSVYAGDDTGEVVTATYDESSQSITEKWTAGLDGELTIFDVQNPFNRLK